VLIKNLITLPVLIQPLNVHKEPEFIPDREHTERPFERLVLRGVTIINGEVRDDGASN
jgi:hypothetical protein